MRLYIHKYRLLLLFHETNNKIGKGEIYRLTIVKHSKHQISKVTHFAIKKDMVVSSILKEKKYATERGPP